MVLLTGKQYEEHKEVDENSLSLQMFEVYVRTTAFVFYFHIVVKVIQSVHYWR